MRPAEKKQNPAGVPRFEGCRRDGCELVSLLHLGTRNAEVVRAAAGDSIVGLMVKDNRSSGRKWKVWQENERKLCSLMDIFVLFFKV
jgi:hypothetical protein